MLKYLATSTLCAFTSSNENTVRSFLSKISPFFQGDLPHSLSLCWPFSTWLSSVSTYTKAESNLHLHCCPTRGVSSSLKDEAAIIGTIKGSQWAQVMSCFMEG